MEIVVTAVGPDNVGLADPIIHEMTSQGANIAEIQMYDHDEAAVFAMQSRAEMRMDRNEEAVAAANKALVIAERLNNAGMLARIHAAPRA